MKVLLIGNYPSDGQESMRRFADLLVERLPDHGIQAECLYPSAVFGRLRSGTSQRWQVVGVLGQVSTVSPQASETGLSI